MSKHILLPVVFGTVSNKLDKSASFRISTQELSPEQLAVLFSFTNSVGFIYFSESPISQADRDMIDGADVDFEDVGKSPSKRLRSVLWVLFGKKSENFTEFRDYYRAKMEKLINHFKDKIED